MRPSLKFIRVFLLCTFLSCALLLAAGSPLLAKPKESLAATKRRVAEARQAANEAAGRYNRARAQYERLGDEVARLQRNLGQAEGRMAELKKATAERAVEAYKGQSLGALDSFDGANAMESARRETLLSKVNAADTDAFEELEVVATDLRERKDNMAGRRSEQRKALDSLSREQRALQSKLDVAARAQKDLEAQLAREAKSRPAGGASRGGNFVNPGGGPFTCPISGPVAFSNDWGFPRSGGRSHQGTDLMSPKGTPNVAVVSGSVTERNGGLGGLAIWLRGDNGTTYYYAHLDATRVSSGRVAQGQVIGTTGNSGNARGGAYHTHFEIHPGGGGAVNPYPTMRQYC